MKNAQDALKRELALWTAENKVARFWLRDDDAVEPTELLSQLTALTDRYNVPVLLAIIPEPASRELAASVRQQTHVDVAVHGFCHRNNAPEGQKKCELTFAHGQERVIRELSEGVEKLSQLFGERFVPMLVPPWNRLEEGLAAFLPDAGFGSLSTFGWKTRRDIPHGLSILNTHVDIIDWKGTRGGRPAEEIFRELADALKTARGQGFAPVGLLTHHLVHDATAWELLEELFEFCAEIPTVKWESARDLLSDRKA